MRTEDDRGELADSAARPGGRARCPLCGARLRVLYPRLRGPLGLDWCPGCGLRCARPFPTAAAAAALYGAAYFRGGSGTTVGYEDYDALAPSLDATFRRNLALLRRYVRRGRLLEFGCASGRFLALASAAGFAADGVELAADAAARARAWSGRPVHTGTLADCPYPAGGYDVVVGFDVLEHVTDPAGTLRAAATLLRPGGVLMLTVPDPDGVVARALGPAWFGYTALPEHPVYFPRATLRRALAAAGFRVRLQRAHPWTAPLAWLLARAAGPLGPAVGAAARAVGLGRVRVPFPFINQVVVAERDSRTGSADTRESR